MWDVNDKETRLGLTNPSCLRTEGNVGMEVNQYHEKLLLDYRAEIEGMVSENRLRERQGNSPAYGEQEFANTSNRYNDLLNKF